MSHITMRFDKAKKGIKQYLKKCINSEYLKKSYRTGIRFLNMVLTIAPVVLTLIAIGLTCVDYPEYPLYGQRVTPTNSQDYIDYGNQLVHKTEYSIKMPKFLPSSDILIKLPTGVQSFESIYDPRGYSITPYVNSSNGTVKFTNDDGINPVILDITYTEQYVSLLDIARMQPINPSSNESFYLFIKTVRYDIKHATVNYNLVDKANLWLKPTTYDSWKNQSIVIYENGIPLPNKKIDSNGFVSIDIYSLKVGECKSYLIKKY